MCGITGYFSYFGIDPSIFASANNIIKHRGPDDFGYLSIKMNFSVLEHTEEWLAKDSFSANSIGAFGFRRLSIIDLSPHGHQPMSYNEENLWIIFNGEIYNYIEIRRELVDLGYFFKSNTDTEVILASYMEWGKDCLKKFNGMWAFAILDIRKKQLFCSRDRLGIKPFYYFIDKNKFCFGSEIKQILELCPGLRKANQRVLFDYIALGAYGNETEETFFDCIKKIKAGSYMILDINDGVKIIESNSFWELPVSILESIDEGSVFPKIYKLLYDSVKLRMRSDVPLGVALSGGLDSSGLAMIASNLNSLSKEPLKLFTIGSLDADQDEVAYAKIIANLIPSKHYINTPDSTDLVKDLAKFIWHNDEPLVKSSMFGGYHVYKLAKENGVTVVLDGQGADELMGGYNVGIQYSYLMELFEQMNIVEFHNELKLNSKLNHISELKLLINVLVKVLKSITRPVFSQNHRSALFRNTCGWLNEDYFRNQILNSVVESKSFLSKEKKNHKSEFKQKSYELTRFTNLPGILRQVDRNSMAFSVEARVPFLDYRLVELLFSLPVKHHLHHGYTKYSYRKSMVGVIPDDILWRIDKRGFNMPERLLLKGAQNYIQDILSGISSDSVIFNKSEILSQYSKQLNDSSLYRPIFWRTINLLVWKKEFGVDL